MAGTDRGRCRSGRSDLRVDEYAPRRQRGFVADLDAVAGYSAIRGHRHCDAGHLSQKFLTTGLKALRASALVFVFGRKSR